MTISPSLPTRATVSVIASGFLSTAKTFAPSRANNTAAARPLPQPGPTQPAPMTSATLPSTRPGMNPSRDLLRRMLVQDRIERNHQTTLATLWSGSAIAAPPLDRPDSLDHAVHERCSQSKKDDAVEGLKRAHELPMVGQMKIRMTIG